MVQCDNCFALLADRVTYEEPGKARNPDHTLCKKCGYHNFHDPGVRCSLNLRPFHPLSEVSLVLLLGSFLTSKRLLQRTISETQYITQRTVQIEELRKGLESQDATQRKRKRNSHVCLLCKSFLLTFKGNNRM